MSLLKILSFFASSETSDIKTHAEKKKEDASVLKSRREFLRSAFHPVKSTLNITKTSLASYQPDEEILQTIPRIWIRPPGAIAETLFRKNCNLCVECLAVCPKSAIIVYKEATDGTQYPFINLHIQACEMCSDFPCIKACQTGALQLQSMVKIGTARINCFLCNQYKVDKQCTHCRDACPTPEIFTVKENAISLDEEKCTGCGICLKSCPVDYAINIDPT